MGGHALEPRFAIPCRDGFADLEAPIPQTGFNLNEAEFNALAVHDFSRGEVSFASSSASSIKSTFRSASVCGSVRRFWKMAMFPRWMYCSTTALLINRRERYRAHSHRNLPGAMR
jgi:hypothetical protein